MAHLKLVQENLPHPVSCLRSKPYASPPLVQPSVAPNIGEGPSLAQQARGEVLGHGLVTFSEIHSRSACVLQQERRTLYNARCPMICELFAAAEPGGPSWRTLRAASLNRLIA